MLKIRELTKTFNTKNNLITAINNVNLDIKKGEIICILGHNGAGKTTLIKCISGLVLPSNGDITIDSESILKNNKIAKSKVGAVLEGSRNIYFYLSPRENLTYFGLLNNLPKKVIEERIDYYLTLFDLKDRQNDMVKSFSRGMQQKVAIMVALMKDPDILLLDEPTLGLDIVSSNIVKNILTELSQNFDKTIIITTHDVSLIENLNSRVVFMKEGKIIKDSYIPVLMNSIDSKEVYELIILDDGINTNETKNYKVIEKREGLLTIHTTNKQWLANNIEKLKIIQLNKVDSDFEHIYSSIIKEGMVNE